MFRFVPSHIAFMETDLEILSEPRKTFVSNGFAHLVLVNKLGGLSLPKNSVNRSLVQLSTI